MSTTRLSEKVNSMNVRQDDFGMPPAIAPNAIDNIIEMVGLDEPDFLAELIDTFLGEADTLFEQIPQAVVDGDWETIQRIAHSMKSSTATFSAYHMADLCSELEMATMKPIPATELSLLTEKIIHEYGRVRAALKAEKEKLQ